MRKLIILAVLLCVTPALSTSAMIQDEEKDERLDNWHQFRGPTGNGDAPNAKPPTEWSEDKNIKWKVAIPGKGHATPIVWKDKVFVTTALATKAEEGGGGRRRRPRAPSVPYEFIVICLDRATGKEIWKKTAIEEKPHEGMHGTSSYASPSATTDGEFLYVSFGSRGLFCYDFEGKQIWKRDLGDRKIRNSFGEGSSLVIHGESLLVVWDHERQSYLYCLDPKSGKDKWRVERNEASTWTTPRVIEHKGVTQVVVNGARKVRSYNLKDGKVIWECGGQVNNTIPAAVAADGIAYCVSGYRGNAAVAMSLDSKGDITDTDKVVWSNNDAGPYVPSPLLYDGRLYLTKGKLAVVSCLDAKTGKAHYAEERLTGIRTIYSSITGADGKVYITGRGGTTLVLKAGDEFKVLATNKLDNSIDASPVLVGRQLFLRTSKHLYCIEAKKKDY